MADRPRSQIVARLNREIGPNKSTTTDRELLARFLHAHDETAFEILVQRHERLVRSAIAKVLTNAHDCDDAFQATFLILVRRAKAIDWGAGVGPWLYGVAHRVAVKALNARRTRQEKESTVQTGAFGEAPDLSWREASALLHAELDALPDRYRLPLLLCYLEGKTRDEAATVLKVSPGTVKGRLERGRKMLHDRLTRRGITLSAGLLGAVAAESGWAGSRLAIGLALEAVRGSASPRVLALTREVAMSSALSKATRTVLGLLALVVTGSVIFATGTEPPVNRSNEPPSATPPATVKPADPAPTDGRATVTIKGRLLGPDKKPVPGANVAVWSGDKKLGETTTTTNAMFQITVPGPAPARATVVAVKSGFAPDWATVPADPVKAPVELVTAPEERAIAGRVTNLEGKPVPNVPIDVTRIGRPRPGKTLEGYIEKKASRGGFSSDLDSLPAETVGLKTSVTTDQDGRFTIAGVGKDRVVLIVARGEATEHAEVQIVTRELDPKLEQFGRNSLLGSTGTLRLAPSRPVIGTVRDVKTGAPVPDMKVMESSNFLCEATTDKDGKYKLVGVAKRPHYRLAVGSRGEAPYFDANLTIDDPPGLDAIAADVKVRRGAVIAGRVTDAAGKLVAGRAFHYSTDDNPHLGDYPEFQSPTLTISRWGELDRDGRYKLLAIPGPAVIGVHATPANAYPTVDEKTIMAGVKVRYGVRDVHGLIVTDIDPNNPKTLTCDFSLDGGLTRTLTIKGVDGKLPDKLLATWQADQKAGAKPIGGTLALSGLSARAKRAVVLMDDAKTVGAVATVTGDAETPVTVALEKLGSVTGRVLDGEGEPVANAEVRLWLVLYTLRFKLTEKATAALKKEGVPETVLAKLAPLNDRVFVFETHVIREIGRLLTADESQKYYGRIMRHATEHVNYDNLPMEAFEHPNGRYFNPGAWNAFTSRTAKADKDGRFTVTGLIPGQHYRFLTGSNLQRIDGELLHDLAVSVKPGEAHDLGDLKSKK